MNMKTMVTTIVALVTSAIVSMDLGLPYSENEKRVYTNLNVQTIVVASVIYSITDNVNQTLLTTLLWLFIKHHRQ